MLNYLNEFPKGTKATILAELKIEEKNKLNTEKPEYIVYENEDFVIVTYGLQSGYITKSIDECALASYSKKARTINANRLLSVITVARNHRYESIESVIGEDLMIKSIIYETIRNDDEREKSGKAITKKYKITEDGKITIM